MDALPPVSFLSQILFLLHRGLGQKAAILT
jgi:hypothetical protein